MVGSELWDGAKLIWPGTGWEKLSATYPEDYVTKLATSDTLRVGKIFDKVSIFGFPFDHLATGYDKALSVLSDIGFSESTGNLTPFPYDWRRDIRDTARLLHQRLAGPDLTGKRIGIVAHSMGGLIARYAMEKLTKPANVELLVLAAVPHHGAPVAFQNLIGARTEVFLTGAQCKRAVNNSKFPAAYQLLPHPATKSFFDASAGGMKPADIYDPNVYRPLGLTGASMDIAKATWSDLPTLSLGQTTPVPYFVIAGNAGTTVIGVYLPQGGSGSVVIDTAVAGDTTVPIWSAAPASLPCRFVPCDHLSVFEDGQMHRVLQGVLKPRVGNNPFLVAFTTNTPSLFLSPDLSLVMPGVASRISVQAAARSIEAGPRSTVIASLVLLDTPATTFSGTLSVKLTTVQGTVDQPSQSIAYQGAPIRKFDLLVPATKPGLLTIDFDGPGWPADESRRATVLVLPPSQ